MNEAVIQEKVVRILLRVEPGWRKTPMMRFIFLHWHHEDYHRLDAALACHETRTSRYVLPKDEGILVGSEGWPIRHLVIR